MRANPTRSGVRWKLRLAALALLVVTAMAVGGYLRERFPDPQALIPFLEQLAGFSPVLYVGIYAALGVVMVPMSVMLLTSGFILGYTGIPVILASSTITAAGINLISRTLLRPMLLALAERSARLKALQIALAEDGFRLTIFIRMSPVMPFGIFNYVSGLFPLSTPRFVLATLLGLVPRVCLGVSLGAGGRMVLESGDLTSAGPVALLALVLTVVATGAVALYTGKVARSALRQAGLVERTDEDPPADH